MPPAARRWSSTPRPTPTSTSRWPPRPSATITTVVDTHLHADHLSGARALAQATGAQLRLPAPALERGVAYADSVRPLADGDAIALGDVPVEAVALPGHTTDMTGLLVAGRALLSGDSLFADGIARPDLQQGDPGGSRAMARRLYETLRGRVLTLDDDVVLLPGHTHPGVLDRAVAPTLAEVRAEVPELALDDADAFAEALLAAMPPRPANYEAVIAVNSGFHPLDPELETGGNSCSDPLTDREDRPTMLPRPIPHDLADLIAARLRVIGDPNRVRILDQLRDGELSVAQITERLGTSQQNASKHLGVLLQAGVVSRRKEGTSSFYSVADEDVFALCEQVCGGLRHQLAELDRGRRGARHELAAGTCPVRDRRHRGPDRGAAQRPRQSLVPAADRLRRPQPVALRPRRRLPDVPDPHPSLQLPRGTFDEHHRHATGSHDRRARAAARRARARPDRPPRPLGRHHTHGSCSSPGRSSRSRSGFFAPRVEHALSGAGWQANGSQSVQVRDLVQKEFGRPQQHRADGRRPQPRPDHRLAAVPADRPPRGRRRCRPTIASPRCSRRTAGQTISQRRPHGDRHGGRGRRRQRDGARRRRPQGPGDRAGQPADVQVALTGASGMWSDFNEANRSAMMRSEMFSWPVTLAILVLAFGSLVAAGLPLLLTILGLRRLGGLAVRC